jgi:hypothetical protein
MHFARCSQYLTNFCGNLLSLLLMPHSQTCQYMMLQVFQQSTVQEGVTCRMHNAGQAWSALP